MTQIHPRCARCSIPSDDRICRNPQGKGPPFCPTLHHAERYRKTVPETFDSETLNFARCATIQEKEGYRFDKDHRRHPAKTRLQEIAEFAQKLNVKRLGLAFCAGCHLEAQTVAAIFESWGFDVCSVVCKSGGIDKTRLGLDDTVKLNGTGHESMCHPIGQAEILNASQTGLNIALGLCVGHDALFFKHSEAPVTVLAAKDRVLGHNPLAAVYTAHSYYRNSTPDTYEEP